MVVAFPCIKLCAIKTLCLHQAPRLMSFSDLRWSLLHPDRDPPAQDEERAAGREASEPSQQAGAGGPQHLPRPQRPGAARDPAADRDEAGEVSWCGSTPPPPLPPAAAPFLPVWLLSISALLQNTWTGGWPCVQRLWNNWISVNLVWGQTLVWGSQVCARNQNKGRKPSVTLRSSTPLAQLEQSRRMWCWALQTTFNRFSRINTVCWMSQI